MHVYTCPNALLPSPPPSTATTLPPAPTRRSLLSPARGHPRPLPALASTRRASHSNANSPLITDPQISTALLLLLIQHALQHVEPELRELEAHGAKLFLGVVAQDVGSGGPKGSDGRANGLVVDIGGAVYVSRVGDFAAGGGGGAVDLGVGKGFELLFAFVSRVFPV